MAKTRGVEEKPSTKKTGPNAKTPKQTRRAQGVAKSTQSKSRSTLPKAAKKAADKPNAIRSRPRKVRFEELEALTTEHMRATSRAKKTSSKEEENPMALRGTNETNTATVNEPSANGLSMINVPSSSQVTQGVAKSVRKSQRIDAAPGPSPTGPNPATVFTVPRPKAKFPAKNRVRTLGL